MNYSNGTNKETMNQEGLVYEINSLYDYFTKVADSRKARGKRYELASILVLMMLAKLCGEDKISGMAEWIALRSEIWQTYKLIKRKKMPSHMTYRRIMQDTINVEEFETLMKAYHQGKYDEEKDLILCIDGKTIRGTIPKGELRGTHLLAVYAPNQGLVLAQSEVDQKENEIVVAPKILNQVPLSGKIVIGDAMHTQRTTAKVIVENGGAYIFTVKDNQPHLKWAIEKLFIREVHRLEKMETLSKGVHYAKDVSSAHGRIETRTILTSELLNDYLDWPYLAQSFRLERKVHHLRTNRYSYDVVFGITCLPYLKLKPKNLINLLRSYWGIENGLHYRRDVSLHEDTTQFFNENIGHNMAIFNNLVTGICLSSNIKSLPSVRRRFQASIPLALQSILSNSPLTL